MIVHLNAEHLTSRERLHDELTERLQLPAYYGRNLDALYDLLTERTQRTEIHLTATALLEENLGRYGKLLLHTLHDAAEKNPYLSVTFR